MRMRRLLRPSLRRGAQNAILTYNEFPHGVLPASSWSVCTERIEKPAIFCCHSLAQHTAKLRACTNTIFSRTCVFLSTASHPGLSSLSEPFVGAAASSELPGATSTCPLRSRGVSTDERSAGFISGGDFICVDIKRDQQLFLRMLSPLREAIIRRIAACAPQEEAMALTDYYAKFINYNCVGGKLMRGLLTVYASLAAQHELYFPQPNEAAAGAAAAVLLAATGATAAVSPEAAANAAATPAAAAAPAAAADLSAAGGTDVEGASSSAFGAKQTVADAFSSPVCFLGWGVELLQAAFLVADDQMDGATTRRGQICWYRRPDVGAANAINDSVFLIFTIDQVLREFLQDHPAFSSCTALLQQVAFKTVLGQHLDTNGQLLLLQQQNLLRLLKQGGVAAEEALQNLSAVVRSRQRAAARLKTSHYSFWLPTALGLQYSGITDKALNSQAKKICLSVGDYFQAQDDFLDSFGCPTALGKTGSDIKEGKCSWLLAEAFAAATPKEAAFLVENYGTAKGEQAVHELYIHLKIPDRFKDYEQRARDEILNLIGALGHRGLQSYFKTLMHLLYRRPQ